MTIADNKKAFHDYFIEERFEAGMALEGWEVKSIRAGRVQLKEAYVIVKSGEIFLFGSHISPLPTASTHVKPDPVRNRKLLMHASEISKLIGKVERPVIHWYRLICTFQKAASNVKSDWPRAKNNMTNVRPKKRVTGNGSSRRS